MVYDRKIKYIDYMQKGERIKGAGFVKLEIRDDLCNLQLQVSGLFATDTFSRPILLVGQEQESQIGQLELTQGRGIAQLRLRSSEVAGGKGIRILISAGRELYCAIADDTTYRKPSVVVEHTQDKIQKTQGKTEEWIDQHGTEITGELRKEPEGEKAEYLKEEVSKKPEECEVEFSNKEVEKKPEEYGAGGSNEEVAKKLEEHEVELSGEKVSKKSEEQWTEYSQYELEKRLEEQLNELAEKNRKTGTQDREAPETDNIQFMETKWKQLSAIYPHIRPFHDEREYLSIGLGDFVILTGKYYELVHNSFLLHGYYNYKHLILTRLVRRGEIKYYIGVPGNFYEREKQVAVMFGFESFECQEEPARNGDYGYYMIPVEL